MGVMIRRNCGCSMAAEGFVLAETVFRRFLKKRVSARAVCPAGIQLIANPGGSGFVTTRYDPLFAVKLCLHLLETVLEWSVCLELRDLVFCCLSKVHFMSKMVLKKRVEKG